MNSYSSIRFLGIFLHNEITDPVNTRKTAVERC